MSLEELVREAETLMNVVDKRSADDVTSGYTVTITSGANLGSLDRQAVAEDLTHFVHAVQSENSLDLSTLRLLLVTENLGTSVAYWERELGLPPAGLSAQPEGVVAGKHMSWGNSAEAARSIVIIPDHIAARVFESEDVGVATLAHELAHIHDDYARGRIMGFPVSKSPPALGNWSGLCELLTENTWAEFAAEIVGARYMAADSAREFLLNDANHLEGIHGRIQSAIGEFRAGRRAYLDLWSGSVTDIFDAFANLGRAVARAKYEEDQGAAIASLVDANGIAVPWKPVVENLVLQLTSLHEKPYAEWPPDPFDALRQVLIEGFHAAGFLPKWDGQALTFDLKK